MWSYLYLWNDATKNGLVSSGIEFKDIAQSNSKGTGLIVPRHNYPKVGTELKSRLDFIRFE
jgi:predicted heme/steroid binding protein